MFEKRSEPKKEMKKIIISIFLILLTGMFLHSCSKKERFIVATSPNYPPLVMINEEKEITGFDIDVIHQVATLSNMNIKIIPVLEGNLLHGLIDETYDIAIASIVLPESTPSAGNIDISYSKPYLEIGEVLVLSEDFKEYSGLKDLAHKTVGVIVHSEAKKILRNEGNINIKEYVKVDDGFEDLALDKIEALCLDLPIAAQFVLLNEEYRRIFRIHPEPITKKEYVIAVKKGRGALLNKINSGIDKMKKEGLMTAYIEKWFFAK